MKKYSVIIIIIAFMLIVVYFFILPKIKSHHYSLNAIVISISEKSKRSGTRAIELREGSKLRYLYYTFLNNVPDITVGDSLVKAENSSILFVKSKDGKIKEVRSKDYILGP